MAGGINRNHALSEWPEILASVIVLVQCFLWNGLSVPVKTSSNINVGCWCTHDVHNPSTD